MNHKSEIPERMLVIDHEIRSGNGPSQPNLAKLCGVSSKTIQRDIEFMMIYAHAPYVYDESKKGWFYLSHKKNYSFMTYYVRRKLDRVAAFVATYGEEADFKEAVRYAEKILRSRWKGRDWWRGQRKGKK